MKGISYRVLILFSVAAISFACTGWAQQASVDGLVPISQLGTTAQVTKPVLAPRGGKLFFSDSPEWQFMCFSTPAKQENYVDVIPAQAGIQTLQAECPCAG